MNKLRDGLVWQDIKQRAVPKNMVLGHFAMWAIRQSPYNYPDYLTKGIEEFIENYPAKDYQEMDINKLGEIIKITIKMSPTIVSWNNPKEGNHTMVFVSRHGKPKPAYDFIDLDALERNIKHSVWLELMYDDGDK